MRNKIWLGLTLLSLVGCNGNNSSNSQIASNINISDDSLISEVVSTEKDEYLINKAGTYEVSGFRFSPIHINAGINEKIVLKLNNLNLHGYIYVENCDSIEIDVINNNTIIDSRNKNDVGSFDAKATIYSKVDTKIQGKGSLLVKGDFADGVYCTKDLSLSEANVTVESYLDSFKGSNSVTLKSGKLSVISRRGDGLRTTDSNISSKGNQKGTILIENAEFIANVADDGIESAYDFIIPSGFNPKIDIKTDKFSAFYGTQYSETTIFERKSPYEKDYPVIPSYSCKGIKCNNKIDIYGGEITIKSSDGAIHANNDKKLGNNMVPLGNISIYGGSIKIETLDDGIHADRQLLIEDGNIEILTAFEGFESNILLINNGNIKINAIDDGINISKKSKIHPEGHFNGGIIDITINGDDCDGIDSNGDIEIDGAIIITRGNPKDSNKFASAIDSINSPIVKSGSLICFGYCDTNVIFENDIEVKSLPTAIFEKGIYSTSFLNFNILNNFDYKGVKVYSDNFNHDIKEFIKFEASLNN